MNREAAPAGSDLDQVIVGLELELAADALELGKLRLVERRVLALEDAAGIGHRPAEKEREELIAEVVVRGDVAPAPFGAVVIEGVQQATQWCGRDRRAAVERIQHRPVADEDPHQRSEVVAAPVAAHVSLPRAGRATKCHVRIGLRMEDLDGRVKVEGRAPLAESQALGAVDDSYLAVFEPGELAEEQPPAEPLQPGIGCGGGACELRGDDRGFHA